MVGGQLDGGAGVGYVHAPMPNDSKSSSPDTETRTKLASLIVLLGIGGVVVVSGVAILAADDRSATSQLVFTAVLPLLGTWVGTVLAFYFARENLAAATDSALALQGRAETTTPVTSVMIPAAQFIAYDLGTTDTPETIELAKLYAKMREITPPSRRLPVRDASGAVLYVIHYSTLTAFAESVGQTTSTLDKMLDDLLANDEFKQFVNAIGFVSEKATVSDARKEMASTKYCNDVFVTQSGKREDRAVGWLTNTLLAGVQ
jgi:hypothetical protein